MGRVGFFRRKSLGWTPESQVNWLIAEPANYDAFLFAPVAAGFWKQHELWDGTYTLGDLLDIHEMMTVKQENVHRATEQAKLEAELNRR